MDMRRSIRLIEALSEGSPLDNPKFKAWFGQSKVVDAQGQPLRCFHGTTSSFHTFSGDEAPYRGGLIAFFSTDPKFASSYASDERRSEVTTGANVMPVYLRIEDPYDFRKAWIVAESFYEETGGIRDRWESNRILIGLGHPIDDVSDESTPLLTQEQFVSAVKAGSWDALEAPEFVHYLHEQGYDGVILLEHGSVNYGIFEPSQVKSAISNKGAYSLRKPGIREQR